MLMNFSSEFFVFPEIVLSNDEKEIIEKEREYQNATISESELLCTVSATAELQSVHG